MPSADQVPVKNPHSKMRWHKWVVLIAGSTGSALRAVRPPNLHITPVVRRDLVYRASATGFLYRSPLAIMAQAIRAILLASAMATTFVGRRANNAVSPLGTRQAGPDLPDRSQQSSLIRRSGAFTPAAALAP